MAAEPQMEIDLQHKIRYRPDIHRLLPQAIDAERGVLSSFLLSPGHIGNLCLEKGITSDHFHFPHHALIYSTLMELYRENEPIDFITLTQLLRNRGQLDNVAHGAAYITELFTFLPTAANAGFYIEILQEKFTAREIIRVCTEYAARAYEEQDDLPKLLNDAQSAIMSLSREKKTEEMSFQAAIMQAIKNIETGEDCTADIRSGINTLDEIVRMRKGDLIVISGEAKGGKTTLAGTIAVNAAVHQRKRVVVFGLEMMNIETAKRMIATESRVNIAKLGPDPTPEEFERVSAAAVALLHADIETVDSMFDWPALSSRARKLHMKRPVDLILLDYIQLVEWASGKKNETEQEVINKISRACKNLAGELGCVLIGLSQMNEDGKLRGSRAIGMHANAVIAVEKTEDGGRRIRVVGQRNGESNVIAPAQWLPQFTRFENLTKEPYQAELVDLPPAAKKGRK